MKNRLLNWSTQHPKQVFVTLLVLVLGAGAAMVRIHVDTDPENMLPADEPARVFHNEVKKRFSLHDVIVLGVSRDDHPDGVFNAQSLARIHAISTGITQIEGVVAGEILDLVHVDNIEQAGPGAVSFNWMMKTPPKDDAGARKIRDALKRIPFLDGTIVSTDGKSVAVIVPIVAKSESYRIWEEIEALIAAGSGTEDFYFAGLPIAEETFGVQMFEQMAIAAPAAALVIFLLMWFFFRSARLVASAMVVAMGTVIITMGALIGTGFTVHIMSSMIPIFLMPIAVVDSVHMLSEFVDDYPKLRDKKATIRQVVDHLYSPMLFTSLTSAAGFLSLVITPIPPVQVFGVFVAVGILLAFVVTIVVVPAFVVSLSDASLEALVKPRTTGNGDGSIARFVRWVGSVSTAHSKLVVVGSMLILGGAAYGISMININDNPVRWFEESHRIRVADDKLNAALAGTYPAYMVLKAEDRVEVPEAVDAAAAKLAAEGPDLRTEWTTLKAAALAKKGSSAADEADRIVEALQSKVDEGEVDAWEKLLEAAEDAIIAAKTFQDPAWLGYVERLQGVVTANENVGKATSLADVVKTVYRDLLSGDDKDYRLPDSAQGVAQAILAFQGSHRPTDLWHLVTPDFGTAAIWLQLKSGDNQDMVAVEEAVSEFVAANPPPGEMTLEWAGLTHINVVWQQKMVSGMLESLAGAYIVVLLMMMLLFRSVVFGLLSMIPLTGTIVFVYGLTGLTGKDYDMPVAVLSSLALGLSIDFAIHFLQRSRSIQKETGDWRETMRLMFEDPGRAITRNAIVIAVGFLPLLLAPLVPYQTVGILMASIMVTSGVATLVALPAIIAAIPRILQRRTQGAP